MKQMAYFLLALVPFGLTLGCLAWVLTQSPFVTPVVERGASQARAAIERAMAREVDLAWVLPRLQAAIVEKDMGRIAMLLGVANEYGVQLPQAMLADINALNIETSGFVARGMACGACAIDIAACQSLSQIAACALPFEMTPAGDLNALRRASAQYVAQGSVDRLDVGLAVVGLGATGATLASGGSSYSIKAGASLLRMARQMGTLSAPLSTRLGEMLGEAVRWEKMGDLARLRISPTDMVQTAQLSELKDLGASLGRISANTSVAETVDLLRYVDTTQDAARVARVSDVMGPKTRTAFEVLGKGRVLRAAVRVSDLAITAGVMMYLAVLQVIVFCAQQLANLGLRGLRRSS